MKQYLLVYRADYNSIPLGTEEERAAITKSWMDWISGIAAENKIADIGNRLASSGKVVRGTDVVTNGPYTEIKELIGGYSIVKADNYEAAVELAKGCPIFKIGGNVEVREISRM